MTIGLGLLTFTYSDCLWCFIGLFTKLLIRPARFSLLAEFLLQTRRDMGSGVPTQLKCKSKERECRLWNRQDGGQSEAHAVSYSTGRRLMSGHSRRVFFRRNEVVLGGENLAWQSGAYERATTSAIPIGHPCLNW